MEIHIQYLKGTFVAEEEAECIAESKLRNSLFWGDCTFFKYNYCNQQTQYSLFSVISICSIIQSAIITLSSAIHFNKHHFYWVVTSERVRFSTNNSYQAHQLSYIQHLQLTESMLSVQDMYVQANRIVTHGVEGYHVDNKYVNSYERANISKSELKRGSYLEDYAKIHGYIPGPGVYDHAKNLWPSKSRIKKEKIPHRKTYIDEMIAREKKEKKPAPGQYKLGKSVKQMDQIRKSNAHKKPHFQDRITYLDAVQYEATLTPGVGKYNTRTRPKSSYQHPRKSDRPQEWRRKHTEENKKSKKKTKQPDMGTYNPKEMKSYEKKVTKDGEWGKVNRFADSKSGSGIGPGKYIQVDDWKKKRPASASRVPYKSVYYH